PTNNILLIDGTSGKSNQASHFDSKFVESLWSTARGAPIRTVRLTLPRGGAIDLAGLLIDDADDADVDLRLLPQLFNRLRNAFNEAAKIAACLRSVLAETDAGTTEIIVADSLSEDETVAIASGFPVKVVQLKRIADRGCGSSGQLGFQYARGRRVLLLDGDMEL